MKYIATILILFICLSGYGQQFSPPITLNGREWTPTQYDTVKVIMLVCDTTVDDSQSGNWIHIDSITGKTKWDYVWIKRYDSECYWQYGYYLRYRYESNAVVPAFDLSERIYLDADKQPLKKSIIVWQSLIIK